MPSEFRCNHLYKLVLTNVFIIFTEQTFELLTSGLGHYLDGIDGIIEKFDPENIGVAV